MHPTMTIVSRIDTLETPDLEPKCIGYAVLRLCFDVMGMQPLSEVLYDDRPSCYFNTGHFMVPILYGTFPSNIEFVTESKLLEALPHIHNAYLKVSVQALKPGSSNRALQFMKSHNPSLNVSSPQLLSADGTPGNTSGVSSTRTSFTVGPKENTKIQFLNILEDIEVLNLRSKSIASIIVKNSIQQTYLSKQLQSNSTISPTTVSTPTQSNSKRITSASKKRYELKLADSILAKFKRMEKLEDNEIASAKLAINTWILNIFDSQKDPKLSVNSRFLVEYNDEYGVMSSLDMLYNMPERKKLVQAAGHSASVAAMRSGLTRRWDNKINYYKTVFRYLPGALPSTASKFSSSFVMGGSKKIEPTESHDSESQAAQLMLMEEDSGPLIIDDATVKPDLNGLELCPSYLDDFSSTVGMKLGPHACLLVIVTAVDILTSKNAAAAKSTPILETQPSRSMLSPMNSHSSLLSEEMNSRAAEKQLKLQKLRGLLGIFVGHKDPRSTWWGIVPLFAKYPKSILANCVDMPLVSEYLLHDDDQQNSPNGRDYSEALTLQGSECNHPITINHEATLTSLTETPVFINDGAHQIPLFQGIPPEELILASDPMAWLINRLNYQISKSILSQSTSLFSKFKNILGCTSPDAVLIDEPSLSKKGSRKSKKSKKKNQIEDIVLSTGSCAIIRVVDPRVKKLAGVSITLENNRTLNNLHQETLNNIITLQSQYASDDKGIVSLHQDNNKLRHLKTDFTIQANKFTNKRTLKSSIPDSIDPEYLIQEINNKFYQTLS